jgi:hypothetical protein
LRPLASNGANDATSSTPSTLSGATAALASACGPPADHPTTKYRVTPRCVRRNAQSAAVSTTVRSVSGLDAPYPALE